MANDYEALRRDPPAVSPKAKMISKSLCQNLWKKYKPGDFAYFLDTMGIVNINESNGKAINKVWERLMPQIRSGLIDKLVDNPKEQGLRDEILCDLAGNAINDSEHLGIARYALEIVSLVKDEELKNTLYLSLAYRMNYKNDYGQNSLSEQLLEARLAAFSRVKPKDEAEGALLKTIRDKDVYEYATKMLDKGNYAKAREFFEMCNAYDMVEVIDKMKDPKKLLNGKYKSKIKDKAPAESDESTSGLDGIVKKEQEKD